MAFIYYALYSMCFCNQISNAAAVKGDHHQNILVWFLLTSYSYHIWEAFSLCLLEERDHFFNGFGSLSLKMFRSEFPSSCLSLLGFETARLDYHFSFRLYSLRWNNFLLFFSLLQPFFTFFHIDKLTIFL